MALINDSPEIPVIRPPSEYRSLLIRVTRGCKWNRCRFCGIYPHLGVPEFSIRSVTEIKRDIDTFKQKGVQRDTVFLGDADPLLTGVDAISEIARYIRRFFSIDRLTCYARASTLWQLKKEAIKELSKAGLNRVHIGLESGDDATLRYHRKGQSRKIIKETADWLKEAGIEISFYVLLGLGGSDNWHNHILETAKLINEIEPEFVRLRRLWLYGGDTTFGGPENPLLDEIRFGRFSQQTPEGTILELKMLLEHLNSIATYILCDHENNYIRISGLLKENKNEMLAEINDFLALPLVDREACYHSVGSRI